MKRRPGHGWRSTAELSLLESLSVEQANAVTDGGSWGGWGALSVRGQRNIHRDNPGGLTAEGTRGR